MRWADSTSWQKIDRCLKYVCMPLNTYPSIISHNSPTTYHIPKNTNTHKKPKTLTNNILRKNNGIRICQPRMLQRLSGCQTLSWVKME